VRFIARNFEWAVGGFDLFPESRYCSDTLEAVIGKLTIPNVISIGEEVQSSRHCAIPDRFCNTVLGKKKRVKER
jgi:hypothetical protein